MSFENQLSDHLQNNFNKNPYLFIGSGLSRRYYGLPTWLQLLEEFSTKLKLPFEFNYYLSKSKGDLASLATMLANEFHEIWWKDESYAKSRALKANEARFSVEMPFKLELADYLKKISKIDKKYSEEVDALKNVVIEGIITTNWDDFLEKTFIDYKVFIGQQGLLFSESISVGEIYKIHGTGTSPETIVVTEEDYQNFKSRNTYLAAKMLTIFVEHPIIFLGYSISDSNVIDIIDSIVKCVDSSNIAKLKDRLIFVEWDPTIPMPTLSDGNMVLKDGKVLPIKLVKLNSFLPLYEVLTSLTRKLPIKLLRMLKESVYEFVRSNHPTNTLYVGELNSIDENSKIEFVVGVGVAKQMLSVQGYTGVEPLNIFEDVIESNKPYDAEIILEEVMPKIARGKSYIPMCKYLRAANCFDSNNKLNARGEEYISKGKITFRKNEMPKCFLPPDSYKTRGRQYRATFNSLTDMINQLDDEHALIFIPYLEREKIDLEVFRKFLSKIMREKPISTHFRKAVCLYDYYKYGVVSSR